MPTQASEIFTAYHQGNTVEIVKIINNGIMYFNEKIGSHIFPDPETAEDYAGIYSSVTLIESVGDAIGTLQLWQELHPAT